MKKWLTKSVAVMVMTSFLVGCANTVGITDDVVQADSGENQSAAVVPATEDVEENNTIAAVTEIKSEERELLGRVLFHHPDDADPEDDEVLYEYEYDESGNLLRESKYITKSCTEYEYDESGNLMISKEYFKDDLSYRSEYEYDTQEYLVRVNNYKLDGNIGYYTEYENDSSGNVLKEIQYESDGSISLRVEYAYDESGKLIEKTCYNEASSDNYEQRFEYLYDASGKLLREKWYLNGSFRGYKEYIHDSEGNLLKKEIHNISSFDGEDILDHYFEYTYDESGALLAQVMYDRDGNVFYDTVNEQFVQCFRYEYITVGF